MANKIKIFDNRLINGIIGFGLAHIVYIYAFYEIGDGQAELWQILFALIILIVLYYFVIYGPKQPLYLNFATLIYAIILSILLTMILRFAFTENQEFVPQLISILGIILFMASDSLIAYSEFKRDIRYASQIIAITYIFSQILLQSTIIFIEV
jgi:uncharacterized membrane protein YhhN